MSKIVSRWGKCTADNVGRSCTTGRQPCARSFSRALTVAKIKSVEQKYRNEIDSQGEEG